MKTFPRLYLGTDRKPPLVSLLQSLGELNTGQLTRTSQRVSSRMKIFLKGPHALPARLKRPEHKVAHEKSSTRGQLDKFKSYASTLIDSDGDDGRDYGNHDDVNAHSIQWDSEPEIGSAIQDDVDAADGNTDSVAESPLSQLPDDVHDEVAVDAQGCHVQSIPTKRIKFVFSAAPEDNNDTVPSAPPPQKKAKKASTRPPMAPPRRNTTRAKRANGF